MGIYMHLLVSGAVTPNDWRAAYQETLKLVQAFSLGELREKEVAGVPVYCLTPTENGRSPPPGEKTAPGPAGPPTAIGSPCARRRNSACPVTWKTNLPTTRRAATPHWPMQSMHCSAKKIR